MREMSVRDMGRLALPFGSRLVAGEFGSERPIRYARSGGALSPLFPNLNADEVALLDLSVVLSSNPALTPARVVRDLSRLHIAALVVKGEVDGGALREAERTSTPLFVLPQSADIARVCRAIIRLLQEPETQAEVQADGLYRLLSQQVLAESGLRDVVQTLHELTGHAVRVTTPVGDILGASGNARAGGAEQTTPVVVGDGIAAFLSFGDNEEKFDAFSGIALEQGAAALALELAKLEAIEAVRSGVQVEFVAALLRGDAEHVLVARARAADFALDTFHWVLLAVGGEHDGMAHWLRRVSVAIAEAGWVLHSSISTETVSSPGVVPQEVVILSGGGAWGRAHAALLNLLRDSWTEETPLALAVGDPAYGVTGLQKSLAEARGALALGLRLPGAEGGDYLHRELGVYRLLRHLQGTEDLTDFLERTLGALARYDREHHAELMATLRVLLAQGGNVSAAAKAMHLHRNSLIYRVERIREISGLDPTGGEGAFTLQLALMLAPLR